MAKALERKADYCNHAAKTSVEFIPCPCQVSEVYLLGTMLQHYVGDIYLQLAEFEKGDLKKKYQKMAVEQLEINEGIQKAANARLNEMLWTFYNNGGQVVDPPVSEEQAQEMQPFFTRLMNNFFEKIEDLIPLAAEGSISTDKMDNIISYNLIALYICLNKLFQADEMASVFKELIIIKNPFQQVG